MVICLGAFIAGLTLPLADRELAGQSPFVFQGGPDGARSVLSTIATAMISVTGLVFSITIVVLQLASSQFTPRVLSSFLSSRVTQTTLGVFTATFIYSLTVMRSVQGGFRDSDPFVPQASVTLAFALVVASVGMFLAFIRYITTSIQVANVVSEIGDRSVPLVHSLYPANAEDAPAAGATWSPSEETERCELADTHRHGVVTHVDFGPLIAAARSEDVVIEVLARTGEFTVEGQALARVWGISDAGEEVRRTVLRSIGLGPERLLDQDLAFGIRQLVDIADRALSPSLNDPTTACQVIDELHRILRPLVQRTSPSAYLVDDDAAVRVIHRPQTVPMLLRLGVAEVAHFGRDSPPVIEGLRSLLDELAQVARPRYRATIDELRDALPAPRRPY